MFNPDPYGPYEMGFNVEMLQTQVYGAVFAAWEFRKSDVSMTNVEIARRTGHSRSQISKLMSSPQNWTLKTISELATALDVDFRFVLVDRTNPSRFFDAGGITYAAADVALLNWASVEPELNLFDGQMNQNQPAKPRRSVTEVSQADLLWSPIDDNNKGVIAEQSYVTPFGTTR